MKPEDMKIGMRVRSVRDFDQAPAGTTGSVVAIAPSQVRWNVGVRMDSPNPDFGHTCFGRAPDPYGYWFSFESLEPIHEAPTSPEKPARKVRSYQPPKTSMDALKALRNTSDDTVWQVLRCIGKRGRTCDEVERILGTSHQSTSARIRDLVKAGRLQDTGKRRNTRTGNKATVWRETEW